MGPRKHTSEDEDENDDEDDWGAGLEAGVTSG